ncbi:MAG: PEGA domain-containing protein, partial [Candidatus Omnitrophota bacterium]|nr:PEGA domain-containing protein [Candidatus Omnitrophota bacterium]
MYQKIRTSLFYISIAVFFVSVPLTLIFSFGYDVTWSRLKFSRAGLINISSKPEGAAVYLNGKYTGQATPASLKELKPGIYDLRLQLEDYYPWENSVVIKDGMVTNSKEITLFRRIPHMDKINIEEVVDFALDKSRDNIFFISKENNFVYKIDTKGRASRVVYQLPFSAEKVKKWLISFDNKKIVYLVGNKIYVGFLIDSDSRVPTLKDFTIVAPE